MGPVRQMVRGHVRKLQQRLHNIRRSLRSRCARCRPRRPAPTHHRRRTARARCVAHVLSHCHRGRPARTCTLLRCRHHRRRHRRRRLRRWPKHVRADPNAAGTQRSHHRHRRHHRPLSDGATLPATRLRRRRRLDPAALPEPGQHPSRPCRSGTYTTASRKRKTRWGTTAAPMEPTAAPAAPSPEMPAVAAAPANGQLHV